MKHLALIAALSTVVLAQPKHGTPHAQRLEDLEYRADTADDTAASVWADEIRLRDALLRLATIEGKVDILLGVNYAVGAGLLAVAIAIFKKRIGV